MTTQRPARLLALAGLALFLGACARPEPPTTPAAPAASALPAAAPTAAPDSGAVAPGGVFDSGLAGVWSIDASGAAAGPVGASPAIGLGGTMGLLGIFPDGSYEWLVDGRPAVKGKLAPYTPSRGAEPGVQHWKVSNGEQELYLARSGAELRLFSTTTDLQVATGKQTF